MRRFWMDYIKNRRSAVDTSGSSMRPGTDLKSINQDVIKVSTLSLTEIFRDIMFLKLDEND